MNAPIVSVCIPTRNHAAFIGRSLESVLRQTMGEYEVVVFDDASTDGTEAITRSFDDRRIRYFGHGRPVGVAMNRNSCLRVARGRYLAWLDADDVYFPDALERHVAVLDAHPNVGFVHAAFEVIDEQDRRLPDWSSPFDVDTIETGASAFRQFVIGNEVCAPTTMVRRALYGRIGDYSADLRSSEDWDVWLRATVVSDVAYTATPVARYRFHGESLSRRAAATGSGIRMDERVVRRAFGMHRAQIPGWRRLERSARAALAFRALVQAGQMFTRARRRAAGDAVLRAFRLAPVGGRGAAGRLLVAVARGDEYAYYQRSRSLLARLHAEFANTRFGHRVKNLVGETPGWPETLSRIAATISHVVPEGALVVAVDKWDPTLLHAAARDGWHFPDRPSFGDGYPRDSEEAVRHLESLRRRGAGFMVFPCSAFWWLEHYSGLRQHLEERCRRVWSDDLAIIYNLMPPHDAA